MVLLKCWCSGKLGLMREQVEEFLESFCNTTLPPPGLTREANNEPLIEIDLAQSLGAGRAAIRTALALLSYVVEALRAAKHTRDTPRPVERDGLLTLLCSRHSEYV